MSKRRLRDYIYDGFFAKDKATVASIVLDAEKNVDPGDHEEPDGDEGDTHVHLHLTKNGDATTAADTSLDGRVAKIEDGLKSLDTKLTKFFDSIKDGDLPPWLAKKDGDKDDDKKDDVSDAVEQLTGSEGAQSAQALTAAEPDLMEADPALNTGPSKMGDAAYVTAVNKQLTKLVQETRSRAEILAPGTKFATFDAAPKAETAKLLCSMRRDALLKATATEVGRKALGRYTADAITGLDCGNVRLVFLDASDRARDINNGQGRNYQPSGDRTVDARSFRQGQAAVLKTINERNRAHWEKQMGRPN